MRILYTTPKTRAKGTSVSSLQGSTDDWRESFKNLRLGGNGLQVDGQEMHEGTAKYRRYSKKGGYDQRRWFKVEQG